jgi:retron-type reverse transcriptase
MKIFERAVQQQLVRYFRENNILCEEQSGFLQGHSTATASTHVTDYILTNKDNQLTGAAYRDLKKAFDTVDPETLIYKLKCVGINGVEYDWFFNYLNERQQCVKFQNSLSSCLPVTCGVPQGSILGPLLFIFFINDFKSCISRCKLHLYADDTILLCNSADVSKIKDDLECDLNQACTWFARNKLHLNISKCKFMMFGTSRRLQFTQPPEIYIDNERLEQVESYKYLGLWMDSTLSWKHHLQKLCNKVKQRIGIIRRIRHLIDEDLCLILYNALILPLFDYCDVVYGNCCVTEIVKLQRLQNRAAKIILQVPFDTCTHYVLSQLKWFYLTERLFYHRCVFMFKCFNEVSPAYLARTFSVNTHNHNTRSSRRRDLQIPKFKTSSGQRSLAYQGVKDWNSLSIATRSSSTLQTFKSRLKCEILSKRGSY